LAIHILSFLDARTLGRAARVSKQWKKVSSDGSLWRNLFLKNGWTVNTKMVEWYTSNYQLPTPAVYSRSNSPFSRPDQSISAQQQLEADDDYELDDVHDDHIEGDQEDLNSQYINESELFHLQDSFYGRLFKFDR
jgi:hypothetical protein